MSCLDLGGLWLTRSAIVQCIYLLSVVIVLIRLILTLSDTTHWTYTDTWYHFHLESSLRLIRLLNLNFNSLSLSHWVYVTRPCVFMGIYSLSVDNPTLNRKLKKWCATREERGSKMTSAHAKETVISMWWSFFPHEMHPLTNRGKYRMVNMC